MACSVRASAAAMGDAVAVAVAFGVTNFVVLPSRMQSDPSTTSSLGQSPVQPAADGAQTGFASYCLAAFGVVAVTLSAARSLGVRNRVGAAPTQPAQTKVVAQAFENELGVQPPVGL